VEKAEAKVFEKRERYKKRFYHASSLKSVAQVIHSFWKLSGQTPYFEHMLAPSLLGLRCCSSGDSGWGQGLAWLLNLHTHSVT
jgi:hypothetical protein